MAYEQKENTGSLFKNDRREKETHPHAKGSALIDGVEYWVSAWTKVGAKGKFQSLSFQPKEESTKARVVEKMMDTYDARKPFDLDDEIPF